MILSVSNLAFSYGEDPVLSRVGFDLRGGELLAILGPNGAGKSSLLKCLNAIHRPTTGSVHVAGRNVLTLSPSQIARDIGYVAQDNQRVRQTVFDAVLMGRTPYIRWRTNANDLQIVSAVLQQLQLDSFSMRFIDQLSGGELQKVAIARALVQEPKLLLLDEPTSSLDLKSQLDILTLLRRVVDERRIGAVITMHDLNTALRYADRVIFLKEGTVHSAGAAHGVTPRVIEEVYGVSVDIHTVQGYPVVIPT